MYHCPFHTEAENFFLSYQLEFSRLSGLDKLKLLKESSRQIRVVIVWSI